MLPRRPPRPRLARFPPSGVSRLCGIPACTAGSFFVSSLDIVLTWLVLQLGGREVNPLAAAVIAHWGLGGAIAFKFSLMLMVIVLCEVIGRNRDATARRLAWWSVGVSAAAPAYTLALLGYHFTG